MVNFPYNEEVLLLPNYYPIKVNYGDNKKKYIRYEFKIKLNKDKLIVQLESIFSDNYIIKDNLVKQLLFDMYLERLNKLDCSDDYIIEYITKLKDRGMKFYWNHLKQYDENMF